MGQFWSRLFRQKDVRILFLGLNGAGKTTILYRLKLEESVTTIPTIGFNIEKIQHKDIQFVAWDIGDRDKMRPLYRQYFKGTNAVVFVIDGTDRERMDELNYDIVKPAASAEELTNATFLFLANKKDLNNTMSVEEVVDKLGLKDLKHDWTCLAVSALKNEGLYEALDWLGLHLNPGHTKKSTTHHHNTYSPQQSSGNSAVTASGQETTDYCSRAYSAIKCLFFRSSQDDSDDEVKDDKS